jgi:hypothetical protein
MRWVPMGVDTLLTKPLTLLYRVPAGQDKNGQPIFTEYTGTSGGYYRMITTSDVDSVSREEAQYEVYLPVSRDLTNVAAVIIDGLRYEVQGPSHEQWNPRTMRVEFRSVTVRRAV